MFPFKQSPEAIRSQCLQHTDQYKTIVTVEEIRLVQAMPQQSIRLLKIIMQQFIPPFIGQGSPGLPEQ